jgi:hypothetical protein
MIWLLSWAIAASVSTGVLFLRWRDSEARLRMPSNLIPISRKPKKKRK